MNYLFSPCERSSDLIRRLHSQKPFEFKTKDGGMEKLGFGYFVEVQTTSNNLSECVLDLLCQFCSQFDDGVIHHVSTGYSLDNALYQSNFDIRTSPLAIPQSEGRIKTTSLQNILQLLAFSVLLNTSLDKEPTLLVLEGLTPLLLSQKTPTNQLLSKNSVALIIKNLQDICQNKNVIILWLTSAVPKQVGVLRDGPFNDPLTAIWKQKVPKFIKY